MRPASHSPVATPARPSSSQPLRRLSGGWSLPMPRVFSSSPEGARAGLLSNAEIVVWQSSRRLMFAGGIGAVAALLRALGLVAGPVWPILIIVPAYLALVAVLTLVFARRRVVSHSALVVLSIADVAVIFTTVSYVTAPAFYGRALLLSLLALSFTQLFFGRTPALTTVAATTVGYIVLLVVAWRQAIHISWAEQAWMLAIFLVVALNGIALHTSANRRLGMLVDLFASAQRGDFSRTFTEDKAREPDGITTLGRSEEHTSELQSLRHLVCRLLLEKKKKQLKYNSIHKQKTYPVTQLPKAQRKHRKQRKFINHKNHLQPEIADKHIL